LYASDFRSYERAFSLFTQVVGRSGRGEFEGKAIIQTYTPYNDVLKLSALQDYKAFYKNEITNRKIMLYPPFCDICLIGFVGESEEFTKKATYEFLDIMKSKIMTDYKKLPIRVLGPSESLVFKVNNKYRYKILIKCKNTKEFRDMIAECLTAIDKSGHYKNVNIYADLNYDGNI
ncbi:MAG: primosomal protein N', partial [Oscillospiraceae bacterium]|nr:primosomal protein N' [Oscillospiraceae bacterium]